MDSGALDRLNELDLYRLPARVSRRRKVWIEFGLDAALGLLLGVSSASQVVGILDGLQVSRPVEPQVLQACGVVGVGAGLALILFAQWRAAGRVTIAGCWSLAVGLAGGVYQINLIFLGYWRAPESAAVGSGLWSGVTLGGGWVGIACWRAFKCLQGLGEGDDSHGSARFATEKEIRESGLEVGGGDGMVVGAIEGSRGLEFLLEPRDRHVLAFAPPGDHKTTALAVPTLFSWRGSSVILDPKAELYRLTAGDLASRGHRVLRWDPSGTWEGNRFDPLALIPEGRGEVLEIQQAMDVLVEPTGRDHVTDIWRTSAKEMFVALALDTLYTEGNVTFGRIRERVQSADFERLLVELLLTRHDPNLVMGWSRDGERSPHHPEVLGWALEMLGIATETRSGIVRQAKSHLAPFAEPGVCRALAGCDFTPGDLVDGEQPVSLFITVPAGYVRTLSPVVRLALNSLVRGLMTRRASLGGENERGKHPLLFMLEEFPQFGRMDFMLDFAAVSRGYGVLCYFIVQTIEQLRALYGPNQPVTGLCRDIVCLGVSETDTARWISTRLGAQTVDGERRSFSDRAGGGTTVSEQGHGRPLLGPDEVLRLPERKLLLMTRGLWPVLGVKRGYYDDPGLLERSQVPPPKGLDGLDVVLPTRNVTGRRPTPAEIDAYFADKVEVL